MSEIEHDPRAVVELARNKPVRGWTFVFEESGDGLILVVRTTRDRLFWLTPPQVQQISESILANAAQHGLTDVTWGEDVPEPKGPFSTEDNVEPCVGHTIVAFDGFMAIGLLLPGGRYRAARWSHPLALGLASEMRAALERGDLRNVAEMPSASGKLQ